MPDALRVDRLQVEVVLRSLLGNAFDAVSDSPRQPRRIWVAAWKDGHDRVCLRIEDSGSGLTADRAALCSSPPRRQGGRARPGAGDQPRHRRHPRRPPVGRSGPARRAQVELPIERSGHPAAPTQPVFSEPET
jgi:hypothetical protein